MIETHQLTRRFGRQTAVDRITFATPKGEVVGFLGPNGAGKSTTIRMLTGYMVPTGGTATIEGFDIRLDPREVWKRIGYLPEGNPLYGEMRVREFLIYRARLYALGGKERKQAIARVLATCWLEEVRRKPIRHLSKGFRQRVGLASALLHDPPVLLLDEPTSGLDPSQIIEMRNLIRELAGKHTVLLSTHILPEVEVTCDRVIMIADGRIRAAGTLDDLMRSEAAGAAYIVEINDQRPVERLRRIDGVQNAVVRRIDDTWREVTITPEQSAGDLRPMIAAALRDGQQDVLARELRREAPSLERIFIRLTQGDLTRRQQEVA